MVDLVVGPDAYRSLPELLDKVGTGQKAVNVLLSREETYGEIDSGTLGHERRVGFCHHHAGLRQHVRILRGALHPRPGTKP